MSKCVLCTREGVWIHLMQVLWFPLTPPPLAVDVALGLAGSDDVTQRDVFWKETDSFIFDPKSKKDYGGLLC